MKPIMTLILLFILYLSTFAQQWINPHFDTFRMDYRDLGYPQQNLIPADNSRITALLTHSNDLIYGATTGKNQAYLFLFNRYINKVRPLGKISNEKGVYHTLIEGNEGLIYIGTGLNMFDPVNFTKDFSVERLGIEKQMWKDIKAQYQKYEGGHLYKYNPKLGDVIRYTNEDECPLEDLGIPVPGNTIYAMAIDQNKTKIYGISYPDAHFFIYDIETKSTQDLGEFLTHKVYNGPERFWRSIPRDLYCHPETGKIYTSGDNGFITCFDPNTKEFELTFMRLPGEYWEGLKSFDYPVVECIDADTSGNVYAATNDGFIFQLDFENDDVIVLGKPRIMRRMRAMKISKDNIVYMITGELEQSCKLHTFDLNKRKGFVELGPFAVDRSPYYSKRAYQFDTMTIGPNGVIFCGESDRRGKLFFYIPGGGSFKGRLNPTNPVVERQRSDTPALIPERL